MSDARFEAVFQEALQRSRPVADKIVADIRSGRMDADALSRVMVAFAAGETKDILVQLIGAPGGALNEVAKGMAEVIERAGQAES